MARRQEIDLQARIEFHNTLRLAIKVAGGAAVVAMVCACVYFTGREFAGRTSFADLTFKVFAKAEANKPIALIISYALSAICGGYGIAQRTLRRRYIEKWSPVIKQFEEQKDPKRTSSRITSTGTTRREDR